MEIPELRFASSGMTRKKRLRRAFDTAPTIYFYHFGYSLFNML